MSVEQMSNVDRLSWLVVDTRQLDTTSYTQKENEDNICFIYNFKMPCYGTILGMQYTFIITIHLLFSKAFEHFRNWSQSNFLQDYFIRMF